MALKPATAVEPYEDLLPELDMLLLMTVEPGFGGQPFLDTVLPKIRRARSMLDRFGGEVWLQVDGGVSLETVERVVEAGADMLVAGTSVYGAADPLAAIEGLRRLAAESAAAHGTLEGQGQN
jgi:ribulose-phosphate 3-epimerase